MRLNGLTSEKWQFIIDRAEPQKQGIHLYYKGVPYPRRVYWSKEKDINFTLRVLSALGVVKKFLHSLTLLKNIVVPRTLNIKNYEPFLLEMTALINWQLDEFLIKDEEFSVPVWEIGKLIRNFLINLGLREDVSKDLARAFMMVLEFDNAYRYRVQDLLGEIDWLDRNTFEYIMKLHKTREGLPGAGYKIGGFAKLIKLILWIPKVSKALKKANEGVDFKKIALDINDKYHTSWWRGYDYGGKDFDERYKFFLDTHKGDFPPYKKREDPNVTLKFMTE